MECPACHTPNIDGARFCAKCGALVPSGADEKDPLIGTIVGGRFRITGILGEGGMGRVYTGEQQMGTSVRKVAVKTLLAQYAKDPQVLARFMRECGTVSELEHPNTIKVYDFGQTDTGELYIAMELLSGKSLESALEGGALTPERVDRIMQQVTGSLAEAHEKGIVHRDLKPANIYLTTRAGEEDYVKVLDFGIAKRDDKHSKQEQKLTQQGTVLGTPPYMSPEQFKGHELDARSDIYSLGVMTYEMLTGRLPFDADTPWAWATQHMTAQPFPFETVPIGGQVPPKMKAAVMRALEKDKERRQQSAKEFFEDLTIGTTRSSSAGTRASMVSQPGGTSAMPSKPGGQTQLGEPLYVAGAASAPPAPGRTMIDSNVSMGSNPSMPIMGGQPSVPTGSGQAYPAPMPAAGKSGGPGLILGIIGGVVVIGGLVAFLVLRNGGSGTEASGGQIPLPSASVATTVTSETPSANPSSSASSKPTVTTPIHSATAPVGKSDPNCEQAIALASRSPTSAVIRYNQCDAKAPNRPAAKRAIGDGAMSAVQSRHCGAMGDARAAASIGENGALNALRDQHCK